MRNSFLLILINCVGPLFLGLLIYVFFRPTQVPISRLISFINPESSYYDCWIISILPDLIAAYSLNSFFLILLNQLYIFWHSFILFLIFSFLETMQYLFEWGTFDFIDLLLYLIGILLSTYVLRRNNLGIYSNE